MPKDIDEMNQHLYIFVNGSADANHEHEINELAKKGYTVANILANPRAAVDSFSLVVLMRR
jgi:hypothetical protein